jgi:hypothetical protein
VTLNLCVLTLSHCIIYDVWLLLRNNSGNGHQHLKHVAPIVTISIVFKSIQATLSSIYVVQEASAGEAAAG